MSAWCSVLRAWPSKGRKREEAREKEEKKKRIILDSSMVEHSAVNRVVVGSSPTRGVCVKRYPTDAFLYVKKRIPFLKNASEKKLLMPVTYSNAFSNGIIRYTKSAHLKPPLAQGSA